MKLPRTRLQLALEILTIITLAAQFIAPALLWGSLPDPMPTHYNAAGAVDGYGSRWTLVLFPVIALVGCAVVAVVIYRVKPEQWNLPFSVPPRRKRQVYTPVKTALIALNFEMALMFAVLEGFSLAMTMKGVGTATVLLLLAMTVTLGVGLWRGWRGRFL